MTDFLVSVIIPTYNSKDTITRTLRSVTNQSYKNLEIIIVDDCSTDSTLEVVKSLLSYDFNYKIITKKINKGVADSRNVGLNEAKGEFVAFIDSDDTWFSDKISIQLNHMVKNNLDFSYTNYYCIDETKNTRTKKIAPNEVTYSSLLKFNSIGCSTVMLRMEKLRGINIPLIKKRNDWALWLAMLKNAKIAKALPEFLSNYYIRENSLSSGKKTSLIKFHYQVYRDCENFNSIESMILTFRNIIYIIFEKAKKKKIIRTGDRL